MIDINHLRDVYTEILARHFIEDNCTSTALCVRMLEHFPDGECLCKVTAEKLANRFIYILKEELNKNYGVTNQSSSELCNEDQITNPSEPSKQ